jgi:hypothetical protein
MMVHYSLFYGIYTCIGAIINNLVTPYGFGSDSSSLFAGSFILAGLISSFFVSTVVDKTKKYLFVYRLLSVAGLIFGSSIAFVLPFKKVFWMNLNVALLGASLVPIIPLGFSFSVELTHPVSEAFSNGVIVFCA